MIRVFRHSDGRILAAETAGGTGGGITHEHHRLATWDEVEAFLAKEAVQAIETAAPVLMAAAEKAAVAAIVAVL